MNLGKLDIAKQKPKLYEKTDSVMWTDKHISEKLLEIHLNPEIDAASRTQESIERTIDFLFGFCNKPQTDILDLGCGPGIYAEKFAEKGHNVTGVDFSENSISYARKQAKEKNLEINYICQDYLELNYENKFDLIILIYTDFGVLLPNEREILLENIYKSLKPNGTFVFDVLNDRNVEQKFQEQQTWSCENSGFWKPQPYLELTNGFNYSKEKVFLKQHTIIDETEKIMNYRFWIHYFKSNDIVEILSAKKFVNTEHFENILPETDVWNGENVTFYKTEKRSNAGG